MTEDKYTKRTYRELIKNNGLINFEVLVKETDLLVSADIDLKKETEYLVKKYRTQIEKYISLYPEFKTTFIPVKPLPSAPRIIKKMCSFAEKVNVGPMAAIAGAISEFVGKELLNWTRELIIENGGDIFLKTKKKRYCAIFAGKSPLSYKFAIEVSDKNTPIGICTSSGTVGPSLSFGTSDAVTIVAKSAILADACATAVGNIIKDENDIEKAINFAKSISGIKGVVIIKNNKVGFWGNIKICST